MFIFIAAHPLENDAPSYRPLSLTIMYKSRISFLFWAALSLSESQRKRWSPFQLHIKFAFI